MPKTYHVDFECSVRNAIIEGIKDSAERDEIKLSILHNTNEKHQIQLKTAIDNLTKAGYIYLDKDGFYKPTIIYFNYLKELNK